jgi:hypothetical protein
LVCLTSSDLLIPHLLGYENIRESVLHSREKGLRKRTAEKGESLAARRVKAAHNHSWEKPKNSQICVNFFCLQF